MTFSWNKWRQYIIEEASVNEMDSREKETLGLFKFAVELGVLEPQDYDDLEKVAMDPDAYEEGLDFNAIEAVKINKALTKIFNIIDPSVSTPASQIYDKLKGGEELDGYDLGNALQIYNRFQDQEAGNTSPEDLDAAAGKFDSLGEGNPEDEMSPEDTIAMAVQNIDSPHGPSLEEDKFDKPGWDLKAIMDSFKEDFEEATRDTDDIPYAQSRVVDAYKDVFAKSHPQLAKAIDDYLEDRDRTERRSMFQNVADDPEVVGRDMMGENYNYETEPELAPKMPKKGSTFEKGDTVYLRSDTDKQRPMTIKQFFGNARMSANPNEKQWLVINPDGERVTYTQSELVAEIGVEGLVQTEIDAFDEAMNDMAIEKAMTATKLDALQNDLEATLSQEEIDALSDAIVLLRKKENLGEALDIKALTNIIQALGNVEEKFGTKLGDKEAKTLSDAAEIIKNLAKINENQEDLDKNYFALAHEMGLKDLRPSPEAITDEWYKKNVEDDLKANDVTVKDFDWVLKYFVRKGADRKEIHALQDKVYFKARENSTAKNREMFSYLYDKDGKLKPEYKNR